MQTQESWGSELVSWGQPLRLRVSRALVRLRSAVLALPFTPSLPVRACVRALSLSLWQGPSLWAPRSAGSPPSGGLGGRLEMGGGGRPAISSLSLFSLAPPSSGQSCHGSNFHLVRDPGPSLPDPRPSLHPSTLEVVGALCFC